MILMDKMGNLFDKVKRTGTKIALTDSLTLTSSILEDSEEDDA